MGDPNRLSSLFVTVLVLLAGACSDAAEEQAKQQRREHLKPRDVRAELTKQREAARVVNPDGSLIPSDQVVAGVVLPRGLETVHDLEGQHYYRTRASLEALRAYFGPRLFTGQVEQGGRGRVTYVNAVPKGTDSEGKHAVNVLIGPAPNDPRFNDVYIREVKRNPVTFPSEAEVRAKLEARRKYAD